MILGRSQVHVGGDGRAVADRRQVGSSGPPSRRRASTSSRGSVQRSASMFGSEHIPVRTRSGTPRRSPCWIDSGSGSHAGADLPDGGPTTGSPAINEHGTPASAGWCDSEADHGRASGGGRDETHRPSGASPTDHAQGPRRRERSTSCCLSQTHVEIADALRSAASLLERCLSDPSSRDACATLAQGATRVDPASSCCEVPPVMRLGSRRFGRAEADRTGGGAWRRVRPGRVRADRGRPGLVGSVVG